MENSESGNVLAVIPARHASTRFPGKPLAAISGKPMIQHVVERVRRAHSVSRVVVATEDARIKSAVEDFGGEAIITPTIAPVPTASPRWPRTSQPIFM